MMLLEDMDTSESEHSDKEVTDDEWVESVKPQEKKRNSKTGSRSSVGDINNPENSKLDYSDEGVSNGGKLTTGLCCTCSKNSSCKTLKCECRAARGFCGISCGCVPNKCSNKEATMVELDDSTQPETAAGTKTGPCSSEAENNHALASHGAMLLQSALVEKPAEANEDCGVKRKPLSEIGNTVVCSILTSYDTFFLLVVKRKHA